MDLKTALGVRAGDMVAFVGAGGKTTIAWQALNQLAASGRRAVFTTTTHVFQPQDEPLMLDPNPDPVEVAQKLEQWPTLVLAAEQGEKGSPVQAAHSPYRALSTKLVGLEPQALLRLARQLPRVTWLIEADGARGRLLKAPAEHEPVIPAATGRVVVIACLDAIGEPLDERTVHRPEIAARLLGAPLGETLTPGLVASLIGHPSGGLKGIPPQAELIALLSQWERDDAPHPEADAVARQLLADGRIGRVILANPRASDAVLKTWPEPQTLADSPTRSLANSLIRSRR